MHEENTYREVMSKDILEPVKKHYNRCGIYICPSDSQNVEIGDLKIYVVNALVVYDRANLAAFFELIDLGHKLLCILRADVATVIPINNHPAFDIQKKDG